MSRILYASIMSILFVGSFLAQSAPPSIFVYESSQGGPKADAAASGLAQWIFANLYKKYPCIDMLDKLGVTGMLEFERMGELLGAEPNDELLKQLGGAIGARYVVNVSATQLPNGTVYMQVVVMDTATGKAIARRDAPPATDQTANSAIETLTAQTLSDMANLLQGKCDEHWAGSLSFIYKYDKSDSKSGEGSPSIADYAKAKTKFADRTTASDEIYVMLRPMSLGTAGFSSPKAQFTRAFEYHHTSSMETTMQVRCRPRGANSYLRPTTERRTEKMDETGNAKGILTVSISVYENGEYTIRLDRSPEIKTKWIRQEFEQRPGGCEDPAPMTATSTGEDSVFASGYMKAGNDITGKVDPKNPDTLAGTLTIGDPDVGIQTITWNLRRVRPKGRNEK
jgi:hypothetical protein